MRILCPMCHMEIINLVAIETHPRRFDVYINSMGRPVWDENDTETGYIFECPECDKVVANTENEAIIMLRGEKSCQQK